MPIVFGMTFPYIIRVRSHRALSDSFSISSAKHLGRIDILYSSDIS